MNYTQNNQQLKCFPLTKWRNRRRNPASQIIHKPSEFCQCAQYMAGPIHLDRMSHCVSEYDLARGHRGKKSVKDFKIAAAPPAYAVIKEPAWTKPFF